MNPFLSSPLPSSRSSLRLSLADNAQVLGLRGQWVDEAHDRLSCTSCDSRRNSSNDSIPETSDKVMVDIHYIHAQYLLFLFIESADVMRSVRGETTCCKSSCSVSTRPSENHYLSVNCPTLFDAPQLLLHEMVGSSWSIRPLSFGDVVHVAINLK